MIGGGARACERHASAHGDVYDTSGRLAAALTAFAVASATLAGCGYHLATGGLDPLGPFTVEGISARAPEAVAMGALEEGARAELAREGALAAPGERARGRVVVEVLRVEEVGCAEEAAPDPSGALPLARAVCVSVVGRARILEEAGREGPEEDRAPARDTGDMRSAETVAAPVDPRIGALVRDEAARRAARRLGGRLARRLLGYPEAGGL